MTDIRISLPPGLALPNANSKVHWSVRWKQQQHIKFWTAKVIRDMRIAPMERCEITVVVHPSPRTRRFDPANWADAGKPAIDALTMTKIIPDDSSVYVPRVSYIAGDPVPGWQLELLVTPLPGIQSTT